MANEARHTKGPWHVGGTGSASAKGMTRVWGPDRAAVCAISERRTLGVEETPEMDANAKLIAAAPELADALEALLDDAELRCNQVICAQARLALQLAGRLP